MATVSFLLTWTPSGDGNGYAVGVDTVSRAGASSTAASYATVYDVGGATSLTLTGLTPSTTYYVGVSSYGTFGDTSLYSLVEAGNEFSFVSPAEPVVVPDAPATATSSGKTFSRNRTFQRAPVYEPLGEDYWLVRERHLRRHLKGPR